MSSDIKLLRNLLNLSYKEIEKLFDDFEFEFTVESDSTQKGDLKRLKKILYKICAFLEQNDHF